MAGVPQRINSTVTDVSDAQISVKEVVTATAGPSSQNGDGTVVISGELKRWHKLALTLDGPYASETGAVNPFLDYRMDVIFSNGELTYTVPGYFAADGDAANTSSDEGTKWRVHLCPDLVGKWSYIINFRQGPNVAVDGGGETLAPYHGIRGAFTISKTDKAGRDLRGKGRLTYVGKHHLQFAGSGEYFLKVGADSPENFLAYADFDNTPNRKGFRKTWGPHAGDWNPGDPVWKDGLGKNIIGALNYLSKKGMNAFSFLTLSAGGDDGNVFMWISLDSRTRYDCSKLEQWEIVFAHADAVGMFMEFKTQEQENDQLLDGGEIETERRLYYRELIARYSHHLSLTWNLGEENTNTKEQRRAFADFIRELDPYDHLIAVHTQTMEKDDVYVPLLGHPTFDGASLQSKIYEVQSETKRWIDRSAASGRPWIVTNDEQNPCKAGVLPDAEDFWHNTVRKYTLWGNIMAGGAGVGYYFGYDHAHSDLTCEDWRTRDHMWDMSRFAHELFVLNSIPFWDMQGADEMLTGKDNYCFYKTGKIYLLYLKSGGTAGLDLSGVNGKFEVKWYDPKNGGELQDGIVKQVTGGSTVNLGVAPYEPARDWVVLVRLK